MIACVQGLASLVEVVLYWRVHSALGVMTGLGVKAA